MISLDITKLEDLNQVLSHPPLLTSRKANWNNIFLAHYQHPASETCEHTMQQLTLEIMDVNSWTNHERRIGGKHLSYRIGGVKFVCVLLTQVTGHAGKKQYPLQ
ncbi:MAG: hypothetical protein N2235_10280 [Fischerella sp.]|nr:hypothetical protein [Fischerella sp.]